MGIELNNQQIYALYDIRNWWNKKKSKQVFEISARAGCGKTFLVRYAIDDLGIDINDVAYVAFSGKAATQLSKTGLPAQTIHSLIYDCVKTVVYDENGNIVLNKNGKPRTAISFQLKDSLPKHIKLIVLDEGGMVSEDIGKDLLSFGVPIIVLGDLNQLPPVFGNQFFLKDPDVILTQIMRQSENDPIVWLADQVLSGNNLTPGVYGKSFVINKSDLNTFMFNQADTVITCTNKLRWEINKLYRENLLHLRNPAKLNEGEKLICRKNNWNRNINDVIYLTNGLTGFVDYIDRESFNGKTIKIDFRPDFIKNKAFKNLEIDYTRLFTNPMELHDSGMEFNKYKDTFEFAYAITCHLAQGETYSKVLFLNEKGVFDKDTYRKLQYTAITRASESIGIVL